MTEPVLLRLQSCSLFRGMACTEIAPLFGDAVSDARTPRILSYSDGEIIANGGDPYEELIFLISGEAAAELQDYSGKTLRVETLAAPTAVATGVLFAEDNALPVTLTASGNVEALKVGRARVLALLQRNAVFLKNWLAEDGARLLFLAEKLRLLRFTSLKRKIAGYCLESCSKTKSEVFEPRYNREQLADLFGVERPSLSRALSEMDKAGLIALEGRKIRALDRAALRGLIDETA